jgi:hypothetical protein
VRWGAVVVSVSLAWDSGIAAARLPLQKATMKNLHGKENSAERQPGQVKALDGVSPQPQNWQRLACLSQALVVEVHASPWITHN